MRVLRETNRTVGAAVGALLTVCLPITARAQFVYVNNNIGAGGCPDPTSNSINAFAVGSGGTLTPLAGFQVPLRPSGTGFRTRSKNFRIRMRNAVGVFDTDIHFEAHVLSGTVRMV